MPERMQQFVSRAHAAPDKRPAETRRGDFLEIYRRFSADSAAAQAARCAQCGVPFCQHHCPLGNDIPDWLRLVAEGRLADAYARVAATNPMPEICGRICPQDRLCEGSCVIEQSGHGTVTIGAVEEFVTEEAFDRGWVAPLAPRRALARSVGVVGAGPAGLAAAETLREAGCDVTVYDRSDRAGGLLVYGIPNFKLDKRVVARRVERLASGGVRFVLGFEVGRDATLGELRARHDAILLATGVYKPRALDCAVAPGAQPVEALDYLTASNRKGFGDAVAAFDSGQLNAAGRRVAVIGGGDTAMDCVRTAIRQGATSVTCLYRRDRANMPGSAREVAHAEEEGVRFEWLAAPHEVRSDRLFAARMRLAAAAADGRCAVVATGEHFRLGADLVIAALGFEPEDLPGRFNEPGLALTRRGALRVDPVSWETSLPGVYAAGDIVRGASLVVWALRDGREAARAIAQRLASGRRPAGALAAAE
jgi:glutamate synthase (NADPH/NADH) small chain